MSQPKPLEYALTEDGCLVATPTLVCRVAPGKGGLASRLDFAWALPPVDTLYSGAMVVDLSGSRVGGSDMAGWYADPERAKDAYLARQRDRIAEEAHALDQCPVFRLPEVPA